eukprot:1326323-Amphidinium_carterae.1
MDDRVQRATRSHVRRITDFILSPGGWPKRCLLKFPCWVHYDPISIANLDFNTVTDFNNKVSFWGVNLVISESSAPTTRHSPRYASMLTCTFKSEAQKNPS